MEEKALERKSKKNILLGTVLGLVYFALEIVSGFLVTRACVSYFGKGLYGIFTLSSSLATLFLLDFGIGTITSKYVSQYLAKGDKEGANRFVTLILKIFLLLDVAILIGFVVSYFLVDHIYVGLLPEERDILKQCFIITASFALISFPTIPINGVFLASEDFVFQKLTSIVQKVVVTVLALLVVYREMDIYALVWANAIGTAALFLMRVIGYRFVSGFRIDNKLKLSKAFLKEVLGFSSWVIIISVCWRLYSYLTPSILGITCTSTDISIFNVSNTVDMYILALTTIMSSFFFSKIARIDTKEKSDEKLYGLARKVGKVQVAILFLLFAGFISCGQEFIMVWMKYDETFLTSYYGVLILSGYQLLYGPQDVLRTAMYLRNRSRDLAIGQIVSTVLYLGLVALLSYFFGVFGAFVGIGVSKVVQVVLDNFFFSKRIKVFSLKKYLLDCYWPAVPAFVISVAAGLTIHFVVRIDFLPKMILAGGSVVVIYAILYYFIGLSHAEKDKIRSYLPFHRK